MPQSGPFHVGDKVRLLRSSFLRRTIGHLWWVQVALRENTVFTVVRVQMIYSEQFINIRGLHVPDHAPLCGQLFQSAD